jgi:hypothetical protein
MDSGTTPATITAATWGQRNWDELLSYIEQKSVIPILGPDLVLVERNGKGMTLEQYVALELATKLELPVKVVGELPSLHHVMCLYYQLNPDASKRYPYTVVPQILKQATFAPPAPLRQLAEITDFALYVNTTFDSLLFDTLNQVRYGRQVGIEQVTYWYKEPADFKESLAALHRDNRALVFHLLGQACANPNSYVLTEEDLLEFVYALQSVSHSPKNLLGELATHNLLFIGEVFPDWLKRLVLRTTKGARLSGIQDTSVFADSRTPKEEGLKTFLRHFSGHTWIYSDGPIEFVAQLHRRWRERNPGSPLQATVPFVPPAREMPPEVIFLSYNRENKDAVIRLKSCLEKAGLPVWFDLEQLEIGENWPNRIAGNIKSCLLFMPVMSRVTSAERRDVFFRVEWNQAVKKREKFHQDEVFILPVVVDDLPRGPAESEFPGTNITRAEGGELNERTVESIQRVYASALAAHRARQKR